MVVDMSIAPVVAQKKAENFGIAETAAVVFAATYEGTTDSPKDTETCIAEEREGTQTLLVLRALTALANTYKA